MNGPEEQTQRRTPSGRPDRVTVVAADERRPGPGTPGMERQEAFATDGMWSGLVRTEPGTVSGWHHHGAYETVVYLLSGAIRVDFGPDGAESVTARPGDFLRVPAGTVHREGNPSAEPAEALVIRAGTGPSTFNVDGPPPA
ncbi:cupin domain-containing protein [Streptomyces sp. MUM 2J]|uniref:cupin domain-containing protein n=1 Tax=Streptomyces sp. MUM 2J TaxID=2791987 RepID=UPI001F040CCB|nr:cupin domain-containing protein [Streptomyces sp. MUM 2J]MCH0563573.1 cupin domain-containing protein [Streptomyces sp. MUM 2J]